MKKIDLTGKTFERLTVIEEAQSINGKAAWKCKCVCGTIKIVKSENLRDGSTKSCGCLNNDQRSARAKDMYSKIIKYHPSKTTARRVWRSRYEEMPFEDFYGLSQLNCFYCNGLPNNVQNAAICDKKSSQYAKDNGCFTYNGLDRLDNSLPHSKENCVACCKYCNYAKRERSLEEFKTWIISLHNNFIEKKK